MKKKELDYLKSEVDLMASHGTIPVNREVLKELIEQYEERKNEPHVREHKRFGG